MSTERSGGQRQRQRQQEKKGCMLGRALDAESQHTVGHSGSVAVEPADAVQVGSLNQDRSDTQQEKFNTYCKLHK